MSIEENILALKERTNNVCQRCRRDPNDILIVAVSKTFGVDRIEIAIHKGILDFGENYVQELKDKRERFREIPVRWHFVGHLQTNKVKYIADFIHLIHSVDSLRLAEELQKQALKLNKIIDVLIEVHTTDEATKSGVLPSEAIGLIKQIAELDRIKIKGLMTMGPFAENPEESRPSFRLLRELKYKIVN